MGGAAFVAGDNDLQARNLIEQVADLVAGGEVGGAHGGARLVGLDNHLGGAV